jgi:peptidoglycan/LPS O-acetylase OafA/YrhL
MTDRWSPVAHVIRRLGLLNWSGVDLFFVLSGFLLGGLLLDNRAATNYFKVFYFRRACRILPIYYLLLAAFVISRSLLHRAGSPVAWFFEPYLPAWPYFLFVQNIAMGLKETTGPNWLGMTWSLAIEEQFYLVLPLLIFLVPRRALLYVVAALGLAAPVLRCVSPGFHAFVNMPWRADSLLAGVALSILVRSRRFMAEAESRRRQILILFSILLAGAVFMSIADFHAAAVDPYNHFWLAGLYAVFILIAIIDADRPIGRVLKTPILAWVGTVSYGVYLYHEQVLGLLYGWLRGHQPYINTFADAGVTLLALALTFGVAALSYYSFERPILRYGHTVKYRHPG